MSCNRMIGPFPCCSVVQGDCLELLKLIPDGAVDAVVTSPPYDLARDYKAEWKLDLEGTFAQLARVIARTGSVAFNIASTYQEDGSESLTPYKAVFIAESVGLKLKQSHVYQRHGAPHPKWALMRKNRVDHEFIFHFTLAPLVVDDIDKLIKFFKDNGI